MVHISGLSINTPDPALWICNNIPCWRSSGRCAGQKKKGVDAAPVGRKVAGYTKLRFANPRGFQKDWTGCRIKSYSILWSIPMRSTQQLSITLPNEMAEQVRAKVATGEYATESEVIRDGLRALLAQDRAVESWLRDQVGPAHDAMKADPSRAVTVAEVRSTLAAAHQKASAKR